jgi:hypothetical protein
LLDKPELLGFIDMNARLDGKGQFPSSFDAKFAAEINSFDFWGNNLDSMVVNGQLMEKKFNGYLNLSDELVNLDFLGLFDLSEDPPVFNFSATLDDVYLSKLNLIERDTSSRISSSVEFDFSGSNLDNLHGKILINNTAYHEEGQDYVLDSLVLNAHPVNNGDRALSLRSDYMDADFQGDFSYSQIYPAFLKILHNYLPSLMEDETIAGTEVPEQFFHSVITLKNTKPLSDLFIPDILINDVAVIESRFNSDQGMLGIVINSPDITLFGTTVKNWNLNMNARNDMLSLKTGARQLLFKESTRSDTLALGIEGIKLSAALSGDTINYQIEWEEEELSRSNSGDMRGFLTFINSPKLEFRITESDLVINGVPWWFNSENSLFIDSTSISINNLVLESHSESIDLDGKISSDSLDKLNVRFNNYNLLNLEVLLMAYGIDISGAINGNLELVDVYNDFNFLANFAINDFFLNQEELGDLLLRSSWDPYNKSVWIDSEIKYTGNVGTIIPFKLQGYYYPESRTDNFDLKAQLYNFKLETTQPFLDGILSGIKGLATGEVDITGPLSAPLIKGEINLMRTEFKVDFSNAQYSLADVVYIEKDRIYANNVNVYDKYGNTAVANLLFRHNNFADWTMDMNIQASELAGLETSAADNDLFYGRVFATGNLSMSGPFDDLTMDIRARTEPQTNISIPISFAVGVSDNDFIVFVDPESENNGIVVEKKEPSAFRVNMDANITPDATVQIFLPYQMGNIRSSGSGNMQMYYNTTGDFTLFGDYVTSEGTFFFTLQNMINRTFTLSPGGIIRWSGDPYNAIIDMQAVYRTRVTLNSLPNISESGRYPVECILSLQSSLMNPEISFKIRMPNVDEEIQRQVFSAIDTTNEVVMNRQMISLLVLNSFNFSTDQSNLASTLGASSFEMLSNQLNSWLSQVSKDFDIGINYRPGDQLSSEELELALSTQLFDDRVVVDGNLGVIGEPNTEQNASNIIGDINVEVKLTRDGRFRVKAFNKYNNLEITRREAPYTQGVGAFYRREFDRLPDLWIPQKRFIIERDSFNGKNGFNNNISSPELSKDEKNDENQP